MRCRFGYERGTHSVEEKVHAARVLQSIQRANRSDPESERLYDLLKAELLDELVAAHRSWEAIP